MEKVIEQREKAEEQREKSIGERPNVSLLESLLPDDEVDPDADKLSHLGVEDAVKGAAVNQPEAEYMLL